MAAELFGATGARRAARRWRYVAALTALCCARSPTSAHAEDAAPITVSTPDGRAVILRPDGTWTAVAAAPVAPAQAAVLSVISCTDDASGPYMSIEMGLKNAAPEILGRAHLTFNFLDRRGAIFTGGEAYFSNVPPGKTLVTRLMAVFYVSCEQVGRIDVTGAVCDEATPQRRSRDCFADVSVAPGVLTLTK